MNDFSIFWWHDIGPVGDWDLLWWETSHLKTSANTYGDNVDNILWIKTGLMKYSFDMLLHAAKNRLISRASGASRRIRYTNEPKYIMRLKNTPRS